MHPYRSIFITEGTEVALIMQACFFYPLTHSQRNAAGSYDLSVGLPDTFAGVLQVVHVHIDVPDVSHHEGLVRSRPGAAVVSSQQGRFNSHLPGAKPASEEEEGICSISVLHCFWISSLWGKPGFEMMCLPISFPLHLYCTAFGRKMLELSLITSQVQTCKKCDLKNMKHCYRLKYSCSNLQLLIYVFSRFKRLGHKHTNKTFKFAVWSDQVRGCPFLPHCRKVTVPPQPNNSQYKLFFFFFYTTWLRGGWRSRYQLGRRQTPRQARPPSPGRVTWPWLGSPTPSQQTRRSAAHCSASLTTFCRGLRGGFAAAARRRNPLQSDCKTEK